MCLCCLFFAYTILHLHGAFCAYLICFMLFINWVVSYNVPIINSWNVCYVRHFVRVVVVGGGGGALLCFHGGCLYIVMLIALDMYTHIYTDYMVYGHLNWLSFILLLCTFIYQRNWYSDLNVPLFVWGTTLYVFMGALPFG